MEKEAKEGFLKNLQAKWELESVKQVVLVLVVFSCTGMTVLFIKEPIFDLLGISAERGSSWKTFLYLLFVLPLYQGLLLGYGFIFGQFHFFWNKEKQLIKRIGKVFSRS